MTDAFRRYLQDFLTRKNIDPSDIHFDNVTDFKSMLKELKIHNTNYSNLKHQLKVIFSLYQKGINLYEADYKTTPQYLQAKYKWIPISDNVKISVENYIECFLLDKYELKYVYKHKSIYAMGNPNELEESKCRLAEKIKSKMNGDSVGMTEDNTEDCPDKITGQIKNADTELVNKLCRPFVFDPNKFKYKSGGLFPGLNKYLDFDVTLFSLDDIKQKAEICKIVYFFDELQHRHFPELQEEAQEKKKTIFEVINFLSQPSIENKDYSISGSRRKSHNGHITRLIKNELEKEMTIQEIIDVKDTLADIATAWDDLLNDVYEAISKGKILDFDQGIRILNSILGKPNELTWPEIRRYNFKEEDFKPPLDGSDKVIEINPYKASPITALYLKISQFERLGEIKDIIWANQIKFASKPIDYSVPQEFIERMKVLDEPISTDSIKEYIKKNSEDIAKLVYLRTEPTQKQRQKVLDNRWRVPILLECCSHARPFINIEKEVSKLLIISCLQAILTGKEEDGEYNFYNSQSSTGNNHPIKTSFNKNNKEKHLVEAIKLCWAREVTNHWYGNTGKCDMRYKLRIFGCKCYQTLTLLYSFDNVAEMKDANQDYCTQLRQAGITL